MNGLREGGKPHDAANDDLSWSVGGVSASLGVPTATLRTWERRYGVGPSGRTAGGHRRYTPADVKRVDFMLKLMQRGVPVLEASLIARELPEERLGSEPAEFDVRGAAVLTSQASAAARKFDAQHLTSVFNSALDHFGVVRGWDLVLAPVLVEIGRAWGTGEVGVETEHLVTSCMLTAIRSHSRFVDTGTVDPSQVVLASAEEDQHKLPVVALEAALADLGVPSLELGSRLPADSVRSVIVSLNPRVVFLWASLQRPDPDPMVQLLAGVPSTVTVILAGPGWPMRDRTPGLESLADAVASVRAALV